MKEFKTLFSETRIGAHTLPNRAVMSSMHLGLEEHPDGFLRMAEFYAERARGGVSLIITGGISPNSEGVLAPGGAIINSAEDVQKHRIVTDAVHAAGGKILLQILHAGRYAKTPDLVAPSPIAAPINRLVPREMSDQDIQRTIDDFALSARLAMEAGYDGVEVMGSEGYLINQFLAPATNKRKDDWGGNTEKRMRFAVEITRRVREELGAEGILSYRISLTDLVPEGITLNETLELAHKIEAAGADMFVTGIGWHESRVPTIATPVPRAAFADHTAHLQSVTDLPVAATNRINTPETAEEILASGKAKLVAVARPLLADPHFFKKAAAGRTKEINLCIACNQACLDHVMAGRIASCLVNPRAGRETELRLTPTRKKLSVAVVGAGVAGLSAAVSAAERGLEVALFESRKSIGGQFDMAMQIPGKEEFKETISFYKNELQRLGVSLRLGHTPNVAELASFDEIIIATGVTPRVPDIPGVDLPNVHTYSDILRGKKEAGASVIILGAGGIGFDTAQFLTLSGESLALSPERFKNSWGVTADPDTPGGITSSNLETPRRKVVMLQRKETKAGASLGLTTGWIHRAELARRGVQTIVGVKYNEITPAGVSITVSGEEQFLEADTVVLCTGQESVSSLYDELVVAGRTTHLIGGAKLAAELDAKRAIREGAEVAATL